MDYMQTRVSRTDWHSCRCESSLGWFIAESLSPRRCRPAIATQADLSLTLRLTVCVCLWLVIWLAEESIGRTDGRFNIAVTGGLPPVNHCHCITNLPACPPSLPSLCFPAGLEASVGPLVGHLSHTLPTFPPSVCPCIWSGLARWSGRPVLRWQTVQLSPTDYSVQSTTCAPALLLMLLWASWRALRCLDALWPPPVALKCVTGPLHRRMDGWMDAGRLFSAAAAIIDSQRVAGSAAAGLARAVHCREAYSQVTWLDVRVRPAADACSLSYVHCKLLDKNYSFDCFSRSSVVR